MCLTSASAPENQQRLRVHVGTTEAFAFSDLAEVIGKHIGEIVNSAVFVFIWGGGGGFVFLWISRRGGWVIACNSITVRFEAAGR